jgi:hypothetical protein
MSCAPLTPAEASAVVARGWGKAGAASERVSIAEDGDPASDFDRAVCFFGGDDRGDGRSRCACEGSELFLGDAYLFLAALVVGGSEL